MGVAHKLTDLILKFFFFSENYRPINFSEYNPVYSTSICRILKLAAALSASGFFSTHYTHHQIMIIKIPWPQPLVLSHAHSPL